MKEKKFVGLDVHKETIAIVVINEKGDSLIESVVATEAEIVQQFLLGLSGEIHITFEVGTQSNWLYRQIKPLVERVVVCNARENKLLHYGDKSDLIDADKLARLLRLGSLTEVWQHSAEQLYLKELVRTHENLIGDSTRVKNRLRAIYRSQTIKTSDSSFYQSDEREVWLDKLMEKGGRFRAETLFTELDILLQLRQKAQHAMLCQAKKHKDFKRLCTIPGLGEISVARIITQVGDPFRFKTKRQFWKYCGFAVQTRSSADHEFVNGKLQRKIKHTFTRGLTNNYCHRLKSVFKSAALKAAHREPFSLYYEKLIRNGTKESLARVSVGRKIAATCLSIWKKQSEFDRDRVVATAN